MGDTVAVTVTTGTKGKGGEEEEEEEEEGKEEEGVVDFFFPFDTKDFLCFK